MSKKNELLNNFRQAKTKHERWLAYAEAIYNGIEVSEDHTPLSHTDCEFGQWMLENGQILYHIKSSKSLEEDHKELHKVYMDLYKVMHENLHANIFNRAKLHKEHDAKLENDINALRSISKMVVETLNNMIDEIENMPETTIDNLYK